MSYRGMGEARMTGSVNDPWTQRKMREYRVAMMRDEGAIEAAAGFGAVAPMFRGPSGLDTSRARRSIAIPGLDTSPRLDIARLKPPFGDDAAPSVEPPAVGPMPVALMIGWGAVVVVAAGLFWGVTRMGRAPVTANRRRRAGRSSRRRRSRRSRLRRNSGEIIVRYGQSVDHRTPFFEHWYVDGRRAGLTSVPDLATAKEKADDNVAALKRAGFSARTRKESLGWSTSNRRRRRRSR